MAIIWTYDCIRIVRRVFIHSEAAMAVEDLIFWVTWALVIYSLLFQYDYGAVRSYAVVGMGTGICLYGFTISRFFVKYLSMVFNWINKKIVNTLVKLLKKIVKPVRIKKTKLKNTIKNKRLAEKNGKKQKTGKS